MSKFYKQITPTLRSFIEAQKLFFTASAPKDGRINLSPKGIDSFRVLDKKTVGYLDLTGSGNETAGHLRENGRLTIMMCSFEGEPLILRLYGQGEVVSTHDPQWETLSPQFPELPGERQIILLHVESLQTSCGYGVPEYDYVGDREKLLTWAARKGEKGIATYQTKNNLETIDGLPTGFIPKP
ncbi:MAG: pyridoxamine 5'-phosphate oxidase family protein [Cyanobacteria bacterium P01_H01_bin.15]